MATPDELRAEIAAARADFRSALASSAGRWDEKAGEEWSPREVAQHVTPAEVLFASEICKACGYPGLDRPEANYASAEAALAAFDEAAAKADGRLKYVTDKDLLMRHERMGLVEEIMRFNAAHLREHTGQLHGS